MQVQQINQLTLPQAPAKAKKRKKIQDVKIDPLTHKTYSLVIGLFLDNRSLIQYEATFLKRLSFGHIWKAKAKLYNLTFTFSSLPDSTKPNSNKWNFLVAAHLQNLFLKHNKPKEEWRSYQVSNATPPLKERYSKLSSRLTTKTKISPYLEKETLASPHLGDILVLAYRSLARSKIGNPYRTKNPFIEKLVQNENTTVAAILCADRGTFEEQDYAHLMTLKAAEHGDYRGLEINLTKRHPYSRSLLLIIQLANQNNIHEMALAPVYAQLAFETRDNPQKKEEYFTKALSLYEKKVPPYILAKYAQFLKESKRYEEALQNFEKINSAYQLTYLQEVSYAETCYFLGKYETAEKMLVNILNKYKLDIYLPCALLILTRFKLYNLFPEKSLYDQFIDSVQKTLVTQNLCETAQEFEKCKLLSYACFIYGQLTKFFDHPDKMKHFYHFIELIDRQKLDISRAKNVISKHLAQFNPNDLSLDQWMHIMNILAQNDRYDEYVERIFDFALKDHLPKINQKIVLSLAERKYKAGKLIEAEGLYDYAIKNYKDLKAVDLWGAASVKEGLNKAEEATRLNTLALTLDVF